MLIASLSGLGVAGLAAGTATDSLPFSAALQRALGVASSSPATQLGVTKVERVYSAARGRDIDLVTILPAKKPAPGTPVSLLLHGRHGNARRAAPTGLSRQLSGEVARHAVPPFGFVAVDGGSELYWHKSTRDDNPMAMLLEEVPVWLRERGLGNQDGLPFACTGVSMGGFGALLYARLRAERKQPLAATATLAPALLTSWSAMNKRHAFRDRADWAALDPLRNLDALRGVALGVWCGTEDRFIDGVRRFIDGAHPEVAYTARGKHGDSFNRTVVPSLISFLGKHTPRPSSAQHASHQVH